jgi:hypothetical protein
MWVQRIMALLVTMMLTVGIVQDEVHAAPAAAFVLGVALYLAIDHRRHGSSVFDFMAVASWLLVATSGLLVAGDTWAIPTLLRVGHHRQRQVAKDVGHRIASPAQRPRRGRRGAGQEEHQRAERHDGTSLSALTDAVDMDLDQGLTFTFAVQTDDGVAPGRGVWRLLSWR